MKSNNAYQEEYRWDQTESPWLTQWTYQDVADAAERLDCPDSTWDLINQHFTLTESSS